MVLIGEDMKLLDISAVNVCSKEFIITENRARLISKLGLHLIINTYSLTLPNTVLNALGDEWKTFKIGMSDFYDIDFLKQSLPNHQSIRTHTKKKNGEQVPNVTFSVEV